MWFPFCVILFCERLPKFVERAATCGGPAKDAEFGRRMPELVMRFLVFHSAPGVWYQASTALGHGESVMAVAWLSLTFISPARANGHSSQALLVPTLHSLSIHRNRRPLRSSFGVKQKRILGSELPVCICHILSHYSPPLKPLFCAPPSLFSSTSHNLHILRSLNHQSCQDSPSPISFHLRNLS